MGQERTLAGFSGYLSWGRLAALLIARRHARLEYADIYAAFSPFILSRKLDLRLHYSWKLCACGEFELWEEGTTTTPPD